MFRTKLREVSLSGEPRNKKDEYYLKQLSTGVYSLISERLATYSKAETENMSGLRYQALIVFTSLWNKEDIPVFVEIAEEYYKSIEKKVTLKWTGSFANLLRQISGDDFISITDYFSDQTTREWISEVYGICDEKLQPTDEATKEALKNE